MNLAPIDVSIDWTPGPDCRDSMDRVRGFYSFHPSGANFLLGDGSVRLVQENISDAVYRAMSTIAGGEIVSAND